MRLIYWISSLDKKKKAPINLKTEDDKCFQYVITAALDYGETESHTERVEDIKPLINEHM